MRSLLTPFQWCCSVDRRYSDAIDLLTAQLADFYSSPSVIANYYEQIEFGRRAWSELPQQTIIAACKTGGRILEVGCGRAHILSASSELSSRYTGVDVSRELVAANRKQYPDAEFATIQPGQPLPFSDDSFDIVFSHFVLEHCTRPAAFLDQCCRVLRPGGRFIICCPDFLGRSRMSSQRLGMTVGTGRDKLRAGRYLDALVTLFDSRVRLPIRTAWMRRKASRRARFYVNLKPVCICEDVTSFFADIDAVYLTYEPEIRSHLSARVSWDDQPSPLRDFCCESRLIYMSGRKRA